MNNTNKKSSLGDLTAIDSFAMIRAKKKKRHTKHHSRLIK
jgi:hypothetical protein